MTKNGKKQEKKQEWIKFAVDAASIMQMRLVMRAPGGKIAWAVYTMMLAMAWGLKDGLLVSHGYAYQPDDIAAEIGIGVTGGDVERSIEILKAAGLIEIVTVSNGGVEAEAVNLIGFNATIQPYVDRLEKNDAEASRNRIKRAADDVKKAIATNPEALDYARERALAKAETQEEAEAMAQAIEAAISGLPAPEEEPKKKTKKKKAEVKHRYGEYANVLLTDSDLAKLQEEFPGDWQRRIEALSEYQAMHGKSYKNHLATIRSWARKDGVLPATKAVSPEAEAAWEEFLAATDKAQYCALPEATRAAVNAMRAGNDGLRVTMIQEDAEKYKAQFLANYGK